MTSIVEPQRWWPSLLPMSLPHPVTNYNLQPLSVPITCFFCYTTKPRPQLLIQTNNCPVSPLRTQLQLPVNNTYNHPASQSATCVFTHPIMILILTITHPISNSLSCTASWSPMQPVNHLLNYFQVFEASWDKALLAPTATFLLTQIPIPWPYSLPTGLFFYYFLNLLTTVGVKLNGV